MNTHTSRTLAIGATSFIFQVGCYQSRPEIEKPIQAIVEPSEATLRTDGGNSEETVRFRIRNVGQKPFSILNVSASCGCTKTELDSNRIDPGKEAILTARIKSLKVGSNSILIEIATDLPDLPKLTISINVVGVGKVPFVASIPESVRFSNISEPMTKVPFFVETRESAKSRPSLLEPQTNRNDLTITGGFVSERSLGEDVLIRRYEFDVIFRKTEGSKDFRDEIILGFANNEENKQTRVPISGSISPAVKAIPGAIFGSFSKFVDIPVYIITFRAGNKSQMLDITPVNNNTAFTIKKLADESRFQVQIAKPFNKVLDTDIIFRTNTPNAPEIRIPVRIKLSE